MTIIEVGRVYRLADNPRCYDYSDADGRPGGGVFFTNVTRVKVLRLAMSNPLNVKVEAVDGDTPGKTQVVGREFLLELGAFKVGDEVEILPNARYSVGTSSFVTWRTTRGVVHQEADSDGDLVIRAADGDCPGCTSYVRAQFLRHVMAGSATEGKEKATDTNYFAQGEVVELLPDSWRTSRGSRTHFHDAVTRVRITNPDGPDSDGDYTAVAVDGPDDNRGPYYVHKSCIRRIENTENTTTQGDTAMQLTLDRNALVATLNTRKAEIDAAFAAQIAKQEMELAAAERFPELLGAHYSQLGALVTAGTIVEDAYGNQRWADRNCTDDLPVRPESRDLATLRSRIESRKAEQVTHTAALVRNIGMFAAVSGGKEATVSLTQAEYDGLLTPVRNF
jgi:hypothetical protein